MISRIDLRGDALPEGPALRDLLPRADFDVSAALEKVRPICEAVHHRGDAALIDFAEKFDGVRLDPSGSRPRRSRDALEELDPAVRAALEESIRRARLVHREQRRTTHTTQVVPGGSVTEKWVPVERVGLYAPGGRSVYPSSVIMNVVPAQEAGVESIALASPAAGRVRRPPAPDDPRRLRPARRGRGVRGRRRHRRGDVRVRHRVLPARQHGHRPRQHLGRRRQALLHRQDRHRRRGRPHRDRRPRRRHRRPGARRLRPDQPGRARPAGRRRPRHRLRRAGRRGARRS